MGPNKIFMWAVSGSGEGVNMSYSFIKGVDYCMQTTLTTKVHGTAPANTTSYFHSILTTGSIFSTTPSIFGPPAMPLGTTPPLSPHIQALPFTILPSDLTATYVVNFTAD